MAQRAEWEIALGDNPRLVASYVQPELQLVRDWGAEGWAEGEKELLPGRDRRSHRRPFGRPPGHRGAGVRQPTARVLRRPVHAPVGREPALGVRFDDFPLDSVEVKASLFSQAADEDWTVVLSHERDQPIGRLVRDRDRFRYEAD